MITAIDESDYRSPAQIAARWGCSRERVAQLCRDGRVAGAMQIAGRWLIPRRARPPAAIKIRSNATVCT